MTLTRWQRPDYWNPVRQLSTLREEIDRLFDSPFAALPNAQQLMTGWAPAVDLYEDKDHFTARAELPGMKKEELGISLHGGVLSISGERKREQDYEAADVHREERFVGRFQRSISLPATVEADRVTASYKDGVLTVVLPKAEEAKPKQIEIRDK